MLKKFEAFNWNVISIDGHDFDEIASAIDKAKTVTSKPTVIVASTIKRKRCLVYGERYWLAWRCT